MLKQFSVKLLKGTSLSILKNIFIEENPMLCYSDLMTHDRRHLDSLVLDQVSRVSDGGNHYNNQINPDNHRSQSTPGGAVMPLDQ